MCLQSTNHWAKWIFQTNLLKKRIKWCHNSFFSCADFRKQLNGQSAHAPRQTTTLIYSPKRIKSPQITFHDLRSIVYLSNPKFLWKKLKTSSNSLKILKVYTGTKKIKLNWEKRLSCLARTGSSLVHTFATIQLSSVWIGCWVRRVTSSLLLRKIMGN